MEPGVTVPAPSGKNAVWAADRELPARVPACGDECVALLGDQKGTWELGRLGLGSAMFTRRNIFNFLGLEEQSCVQERRSNC